MDIHLYMLAILATAEGEMARDSMSNTTRANNPQSIGTAYKRMSTTAMGVSAIIRQA